MLPELDRTLSQTRCGSHSRSLATMGPKKSTVIAAKPKPKMTIKKRGKPMDKKMLGAGAAVAVALLAGVFWPTGGPPKSKLRSKKATPTKRAKYEIPYEYQKPPEGECQLSIMDARQVINSVFREF